MPLPAKSKPLLFYCGSVLAAFVAVFTVVQPILNASDPEMRRAMPSQNPGYDLGFGLVNALLFAAISYGLFRAGKKAADPNQPTREQEQVQRLRKIYETLELHRSTPTDGDTSEQPYLSLSVADLLDVFDHIQPDKAPDRYRMLLIEIRKRVENQQQDSASQAAD